MKIYEAWFDQYDCRDTQTKYFSSKSEATKWLRQKYAEYKNNVGEDAYPFHQMADYLDHEFEYTKMGILDFLNRNSEF